MDYPTLHPSLRSWALYTDDTAALQRRLGPFDDLVVTLRWTPEAGWTSGSFSCTEGEHPEIQHHFRLAGEMVTDPVLCFLAVLGEGSHSTMNPRLFDIH